MSAHELIPILPVLSYAVRGEAGVIKVSVSQVETKKRGG
jgi:hypothetical protein